ncbi:MAG: LysE family translocator [Candidatus Acinetobacter avistercoris]|uniref:LysE family translocator n=1 Tax=Acinetobacter sp. KS-LM10 TaxID=3120518 RepID=UPI001F9E3505|nr:LysE family translocator [Candidatus Acinetobacter avistercoris]
MLNLTTLGLYIVTLAIAALIPGPGMTALIFTTISGQYKNGFFMLLGLITGDLCYLAIALFGLNSIVNLINPTLGFLFICCACAYLYYIAFKLWTYKEDLLNTSESRNHSQGHQVLFSNYLNGFSLTLSNPKTMTFYLALVPSIFGPSLRLSPSALFILAILTISTLLIVGGFYIRSAFQMKNLLSTKKYQSIFLKSISLVMFSLATQLMVNQFITYF